MKIKGNTAITLIALIITIIILLIIAGIAISTLGGENGLIAKAKLAQSEQEKAQAKEELQMKIYQLQIKIMDEESREATLEDFNNMIKEDVDLTFISANYKTAATEAVEGNFETIKVLYSKYIFTVDEYLQIIEVELNTQEAHVELTYEVKEKKEVDGKIIYETLIILQSQQKITKIEYGTQELYADKGKEKIAIDYEIEKGVEYKFKVTVEDGREVEKTFVINYIPITSLKITEKLSIGEGLNNKVTVEEIKPDFADVGKITYTSSDESIATVDEEGNVTGISLGTAVITAKEEYSSLEASCNVDIIEIMAGIEANCDGDSGPNVYCFTSNKIIYYNYNNNYSEVNLNEYSIKQISTVGRNGINLVLDSNNNIREISGQTISDPIISTKFKKVVTGDYSCNINGGIDIDGNIWLGEKGSFSKLTNIENNGGIKYKDFSIEESGSILAIDENGDLWGKGIIYALNGNKDVTYSELTKISTDTTLTDENAKIFANTKMKKVIYSYYSYIALDENGNIWGGGANYNYDIGDGTKGIRTAPKIIAGPDSDSEYKEPFKEIELNTYYGMAIDINGDIYTWGLKNTTSTGDHSIKKLEVLNGTEKIKFNLVSAEYYRDASMCAVSTDGYLYSNVYQSNGVVQAVKTPINIY